MKKGCLIAAGVVLLLVSIALGVYFYNQSKKDPKEYKISKPFYTDIAKKTVATGSIRPRREVNIKPQVSGVVEELFVEAGDIVKKGQKIAKIKLVPSQVNINNAQSQVQLARIRYDQAKRELQRQSKLRENHLDIEQAEARFTNARNEEERQRYLFEDGVISEQEYKQSALDLELRKSEFSNAEIVAENNLKTFGSELDVRKQELNAAISNLELLQEGASKKSRQVANIVASTVTGMILDVPVEEGSSVIERNNFNEGTSIADVADMNALIFEGMVDESDVGKLKVGMPIELTIGAIEDLKFDAILEHISPKGVEEEGTVKFEVRASVEPDTSIFLRAGYSASGDIILEKKENVLAIKERDVLFEDDSTYVEIEKSNQIYEKIGIKLGLSDGINIEVLEGLDTTINLKTIQKVIE